MPNATQWDTQHRVVSLANLQAMCAHASGQAHRFTAERHSAHRVRVGYNNPDEYGNSRPYSIFLPCFRGPSGPENPSVVLEHVGEVKGGLDEHASEAAFQAIQSTVFWGPKLWLNPRTGEWEINPARRKVWVLQDIGPVTEERPSTWVFTFRTGALDKLRDLIIGWDASGETKAKYLQQVKDIKPGEGLTLNVDQDTTIILSELDVGED